MILGTRFGRRRSKLKLSSVNIMSDTVKDEQDLLLVYIDLDRTRSGIAMKVVGIPEQLKYIWHSCIKDYNVYYLMAAANSVKSPTSVLFWEL